MLTIMQIAFYAAVVKIVAPIAKDLVVLGALKLENTIFEEVETY